MKEQLTGMAFNSATGEMTDIPEWWQPTLGLRLKTKYNKTSDTTQSANLVLQQLWQCNNGKQEWRDVPIVE